MRNTINWITKKFKFYDFWILTKKEQKRFRNYHLPIFECPSCGCIKNDSNWEVNILWQACVNCWDTESLKEFETSSFKQFKKWKFAVKLDMSQRTHQEIIKHFQTHVLWQCNVCQRQNFNLEKDSSWNPNSHSHTSCEWCGDEYKLDEDFLSFWAMKWFWFDDGDDNSNTYELKKLAEWQFLWLQAIAKARKIDKEKWPSINDELSALESWLKKVKSRSRSIAWGRLKDGQRLIEFLENYLDDENSITFQKRARRVSKRVRNYTHEVIATNNTYKTTPHHVDSWLLERYFYNLSRLDFATTWWTSFWAFMSFIVLSAMIEGNWERDISWVSHITSLERQDKWTLDLQYSFSRREPSYNQDYEGNDLEEGIEYETIRDNTWVSRFNSYNGQREYYRLRFWWWIEEISNWYKNLDTGRDEWIDEDCPIEDDDSPLSTWIWSSWTPIFDDYEETEGLWYWWNGDLFHRPERSEQYEDNISFIIPSIGDSILSVLVSPAYADWHNCGYESDVTIKAERFMTIQRYSVWDWDESNWYSSDIIQGTNYQDTFKELEWRVLEDTSNQRLVDNRLIMQLEARDEDWKEFIIPITNEDQWFQISQHIWETCTIQKSYLMRWLKWISSDDVYEQCIEQ